MKNLHIIDHVGMGGAQTILKSIFEKEKNNKNIIYYALRNNNIKVDINHQNINYYKSYSKFNIGSFFELRKIIANQNVDILHCHLAKSMIFGYILKIFFFKNIKLIFHEHGRIFENLTWYNYFIKISQNKVNLYIAVSNATKIKLSKKASISENKIKVLYNFVDLENFNPQILQNYDRNKQREKIGFGKDDFVVGFAGRLVKRKGWEEYLKSAKILLNETKIKFLIVGDGPDKQDMINLINKLGLENNVLYIGFVTDIRAFYSMIDCFVMPSHWEPSPMIFYEVEALGVPLICADAISVNELAREKENALLFEPKNEIDLAEKISLFYSNESLRKQLVDNGFKSVKKYSLENYIIELDNLYLTCYEKNIHMLYTN
jgi:glycosyltransferase involved in cell wall biosynthesis